MKKLISSALVLCTLSLTTITVINSCSSDEDTTITPNPSNVTINPNDFKVSLKSGDKLVLDASVTYRMTGAVIINDGAELTIPAGTKILCSGGTSTYLAVAQGGKIFSNGTAANPVIFSSASATPKKADWGGIVICGKAPINAGATATSEVASLTYGGTVANDNSGIISYTQIRWAGARFSDTKEYNGLSLFGVGNQTKIDGVAVIDGADDGIEFFGGTVNVSNIVSVNNDDDGFDWTEGWNGTATNIYSKRTSATVGNRGIEADNNANTQTATPMSNPTIKNATFIGYATTDNEGAGTNLFRVGTGATLDNVVFSGWATAITIQHDTTIANLNGKGKFTNIKFDNVGAKAVTITSASGSVAQPAADGTYTENANATGAGSGTATPLWANGWTGL
ncbi:hypothetical protein [Epilithonimonas mollis]|uniref:Uncharacterized protein n=1 Tax=Epilithonimonas mollis TaxID=216903 RepID=A0A1M6T9T2_9FLAO|nr:hypothetical protein [Epilithonimonas mollis]SHK53644.1 hypothetical protein SAMN05444371_2732 [Epilithonimonas mollis]